MTNQDEIKEKEIKELKELLNKALNRLYEKALDQLDRNDLYLIEINANERSMVFRFGIHFAELVKESSFTGFNVDAEYNKRGKDPETIQNKEIENQITPSKPKGAWPDIILHERGNDNHNKLVIEFKKKKNRSSTCTCNDIKKKKKRSCICDDIKKLEAFTNKEGDYKYVLGALVVLHDELEKTKTEIQYFPRGNS